MLQQYGEYIHYRTPLTNARNRLRKEKKLRVVYFGGSVTAGAGASDPTKTSWRALVGEWLAEQFPEAEVQNINRALGESGTYLGVHRLHPDVIAETPDLLFVEYSINDRYYHCDYEKAASQFETLVREVRRALPETDIVTVLVTDSHCLEYNREGALHPEAQAHEDIAAAYGIPTLHVGRLLAKVVDYDRRVFETEYAIDIVHLKDPGYRVYFRVLREFLYHSLVAPTEERSGERSPETPAVRSEFLFDGGRNYIEPTESLIAESEALGGRNVVCRCPGFNPSISNLRGTMLLEGPSSVMALRFRGTEIAVFVNYVSSHRFLVSVDGGEEVLCQRMHHNPLILAKDLPSGEHLLRFRPAEESGTVVCGPFFVRDATLATPKGTPLA